jgi:hypothetical protein
VLEDALADPLGRHVIIKFFVQRPCPQMIR